MYVYIYILIYIYIYTVLPLHLKQPEDQNKVSETFHSGKCTLKASLRIRFQICSSGALKTHVLKVFQIAV